MPKVETVVNIRRPASEVFAFLTDPGNDKLWQQGMIESGFLEDGPIRVGSRGRERREFMRQRMESNWEVVAYEPDRLYTVKGDSNLMPIEASYVLEPLGDEETRVRSVFEWRTGGLAGRLAAKVVLRMAKMQSDSDFVRLKEVLESR